MEPLPRAVDGAAAAPPREGPRWRRAGSGTIVANPIAQAALGRGANLPMDETRMPSNLSSRLSRHSKRSETEQDEGGNPNAILAASRFRLVKGVPVERRRKSRA